MVVLAEAQEAERLRRELELRHWKEQQELRRLLGEAAAREADSSKARILAAAAAAGEELGRDKEETRLAAQSRLRDRLEAARLAKGVQLQDQDQDQEEQGGAGEVPRTTTRGETRSQCETAGLSDRDALCGLETSVLQKQNLH